MSAPVSVAYEKYALWSIKCPSDCHLFYDPSSVFRWSQSGKTSKLWKWLHQREFSHDGRSPKGIHPFSGACHRRKCQCLRRWTLKWSEEYFFAWCLQGPLRNTCGHFWLMIWEQCSKAVIMLNRVIEKGSVSTSDHPFLTPVVCGVTSWGRCIFIVIRAVGALVAHWQKQHAQCSRLEAFRFTCPTCSKWTRVDFQEKPIYLATGPFKDSLHWKNAFLLRLCLIKCLIWSIFTDTAPSKVCHERSVFTSLSESFVSVHFPQIPGSYR